MVMDGIDYGRRMLSFVMTILANLVNLRTVYVALNGIDVELVCDYSNNHGRGGEEEAVMIDNES